MIDTTEQTKKLISWTGTKEMFIEPSSILTIQTCYSRKKDCLLSNCCRGGADGQILAWDLRFTAEPEAIMKLPTKNDNTTVMEILYNKNRRLNKFPADGLDLAVFATNGVIYFYDPKWYNFQHMMVAHVDRINAAVMDEFKMISVCADGTMRVSGSSL